MDGTTCNHFHTESNQHSAQEKSLDDGGDSSITTTDGEEVSAGRVTGAGALKVINRMLNVKMYPPCNNKKLKQ